MDEQPLKMDELLLKTDEQGKFLDAQNIFYLSNNSKG